MKKLCFVGLVIVVLLGCATKVPFVNTFMDSDIPAADHAVLSVQQNVKVLMINGFIGIRASGSQQVSRSGGILGMISTTSEPAVLLAPGTHSLNVAYQRESRDSSTSGNVTTVTISENTTNIVTVTENFIKGRFYRIYPVVTGNQVSFRIIDETDPSVWESDNERKNAEKRIAAVKKMLPSANYPPVEATTIRIQRAMASASTLLEGEWISNGIEEQCVYTFTGKAFTQIYPARENPAHRGLVEINGNILKLTALEVSEDGGQSWFSTEIDHLSDDLKNMAGSNRIVQRQMQGVLAMLDATAAEMKQQLTFTFVYTINPDGSLLLKNDSDGEINFSRK